MVLLSICLIFCQFQPGFAYKSAAYKKASTTLKLWAVQLAISFYWFLRSSSQLNAQENSNNLKDINI